MTIWNMQLHPGKYGKPYTREVVRSILEDYRLIGLGNGWGNDHGRPNAFVNRMKEGDIVVIRRKGPLAIVRVVGKPINLGNNDSPMWFGIARCVEILQIIDNPKDIVNEFEQESKTDWKKGLMATTTLQIAWNWKFAQWWYNKVTNQTDNDAKVEKSPILPNEKVVDLTTRRWDKEIDTLTSYFEGNFEEDFYLDEYIYNLKQQMEFEDMQAKDPFYCSEEYEVLKGLVDRAEQEIKDEQDAILDMMYPNRDNEDFVEDADGNIDFWDD